MSTASANRRIAKRQQDGPKFTEQWTWQSDSGKFGVFCNMGDGAFKCTDYDTQEEAERHVARAIVGNAIRDGHAILFDLVKDPTNWKLPTKPFMCASTEHAQRLADAITYFCGGAEVNGCAVTSRGYYFYVGA